MMSKQPKVGDQKLNEDMEPKKTPARINSSSSLKEMAITKSDVAQLANKIRDEMQAIAQNVSLIQSLIPLVNDPIEAHDHIEKLKEINDKMQTMLPLMHFYMNIPTPPKESDKERWNLQRQQLSREFETMVTNFRSAQQSLYVKIDEIRIVKF